MKKQDPTPDVFSEFLNPLLKFFVFPIVLAATLGAALTGCKGADERPGFVAPLEVEVPSVLVFDSPAPAEARVLAAIDGQELTATVAVNPTAHVPVPRGTVRVMAPWGVSWHLHAGTADVNGQDPLAWWRGRL